MALIIQDTESKETCDHVFVVDDGDGIAWVKVGENVIYIRQDDDGTLVVRAMPDNDGETLHGEIIVPPAPAD